MSFEDLFEYVYEGFTDIHHEFTELDNVVVASNISHEDMIKLMWDTVGRYPGGAEMQIKMFDHSDFDTGSVTLSALIDGIAARWDGKTPGRKMKVQHGRDRKMDDIRQILYHAVSGHPQAAEIYREINRIIIDDGPEAEDD